MADPLSITASIVGITVPALHAARLLFEDLQQLKDAPDTIKQLQDDLRAVDAAITPLQSIDTREWEAIGTNVATSSMTTINACQKACDSFRADLRGWTRESGQGTLTWKTRASVGFFKQSRVKSISTQLQNCKITITSVVSVALLYSSIRQNQITEDIRSAVSVKQVQIQDAIDTTENHVKALEGDVKQRKLTENSDHTFGGGDENGNNEDMKDFHQQQSAFAASLESLRELLAKFQVDVVAKAAEKSQSAPTTVTFGGHNSGFQAGNINGGVSGISFGKA